MSRYIDAEKFDVFTYKGIPEGYKDKFDDGVLYALNAFDRIPTVDVVHVVRCKDCRRKLICGKGDNYFCAEGEKISR